MKVVDFGLGKKVFFPETRNADFSSVPISEIAYIFDVMNDTLAALCESIRVHNLRFDKIEKKVWGDDGDQNQKV